MEYADRVKETSTTTGTGTYSLAGAEAGHQGVVAGIGDGKSAYFCAEDGTDWEVFEGTVTAGTPDTLTRDTILASSNSGAAVDWGAGTRNIFLVVPAQKVADLDTRLQVISSDTTLYVATTGNDTTGDGSSGSPWATPQKALDYLKDKWINTDVTVTIQCADGTYTLTTAISPTHPCGTRITIKGENTYTKSMTSVQSSSGSSGAWAVVINLDSVTDIAVNDFVLIHTPSGGTKPTFIAGCHKVTNVDTGNNRITIDSKHIFTSAPSGAVAATVVVLKTIFQNSTSDIVYVSAGSKLGMLRDVALDGNSNPSGWGIYCRNHSYMQAECVGINGTNGGVYCDNHSTSMLLPPFAVSNVTDDGYLCDDHSFIECKYGIASGILTSSCYGFWSVYGSSVEASNGLSTGGVSIGFMASVNATMRCVDSIATAHTTGFYSGRGGYLYAPGATGSDNSTTSFSPNVNTQGNEYGYIDQ